MFPSFQIFRSWRLSAGAVALAMLTGADGARCQSVGRGTAPDRVRAVLDWSVGELDGDLALTDVQHIVHIGSSVYVAQPQERLIRVLSAETGELIGVRGGFGDGPGEFRSLDWMGRLEGELAVIDIVSSRLTVFDEAGNTRETTRFSRPPPRPPFHWAWVFPTSSGHFIHFGDAGSSSAGSIDVHPLVVTTVDGSLVDTLPSFRAGDRSIRIRGDDGRSRSYSRPLHRGDRIANAVDGSEFVQVGVRDVQQMWLYRYDSDSETVREMRLDIQPVPVPEPVRDSIRARLHSAIMERGLPAGVSRRELNEALTMPEWVPPVDEIFVSSGGEVWLREPSFSSSGRHLWRIVDEEGRVSAEVDVPSDVVLREHSGDHVWGFRVDPTWGYSVVERYRLEPIEADALE